MNRKDLDKYIGHYVYLILKNGFKYKISLEKENVNENHISFKGKFGESVDFDISEISFITDSIDTGRRKE